MSKLKIKLSLEHFHWPLWNADKSQGSTKWALALNDISFRLPSMIHGGPIVALRCNDIITWAVRLHWYVSRFGLAVRRLAGRRKDLGSIPLRLSFLFRKVVVCGHCPHSSGAVWESRWSSWAVCPNEPSGFRGRKAILNHASALVTTCP